jgi:hypothetical protein
MTDTVTPGHQETPDSQERPDVNNVRLLILENPGTPNWERATEVEAEAFIRRNYVADKEELAKEYEPYLPMTRIVAAEVDGVIQGATRLIDYDPSIGFKTVNDAKAGKLEIWPEGQRILDEVDPNDITEVGTIAVSEEYLSKGGNSLTLSQQLYGAIYQMGKQHDKPHVIASFDEDYYNGIIKWFGTGERQLGPAVDYMGSKTVPSIMDIQKVQDNLREVGFTEQADAFDEAADKLQSEE